MEPALAVVKGSPQRARPPVLVIHSWWGLTPSFTSYADDLAAAGFLVGCADLYGGRTAADEDEVARLRAAPRSEPMYRTLTGAIDELADRADVAADRVAVVGFSMGGHWACWLTQHLDLAGVVLYYAVRGGDWTTSAAPVLAHYAEHDEFVRADARRRMEAAITRSGRPYTAHDYDGTSHWFAESDQATYDEVAARRALDRTIGFLRGLDGS